MRVKGSGVDPEEALGGNEVQGLIEGQNDRTEVAWVAPSLASPPQDLDLIVLAGWPQASDRPAGSQAIQGITSVGANHLDTAARKPIGDDAVAPDIVSGLVIAISTSAAGCSQRINP